MKARHNIFPEIFLPIPNIQKIYNPARSEFYSTHTRAFNCPFPGIPRWAGTRKIKLIWVLLKQETVSGSGIRWAICKSAHRSRQITMPATHHSVFYRRDALPAAQPTVSKHCQSTNTKCNQNQMRVPHHHTDCHWQSVPKAVLNTSDHWRRTTKACVWLATYDKSVTAQTKLNSIFVMQSLLSQMTFTHNKNKTTSDHRSSMPMVESDWQGIASY